MSACFTLYPDSPGSNSVNALQAGENEHGGRRASSVGSSDPPTAVDRGHPKHLRPPHGGTKPGLEQ